MTNKIKCIVRVSVQKYLKLLLNENKTSKIENKNLHILQKKEKTIIKTRGVVTLSLYLKKYFFNKNLLLGTDEASLFTLAGIIIVFTFVFYQNRRKLLF